MKLKYHYMNLIELDIFRCSVLIKHNDVGLACVPAFLITRDLHLYYCSSMLLKHRNCYVSGCSNRRLITCFVFNILCRLWRATREDTCYRRQWWVAWIQERSTPVSDDSIVKCCTRNQCLPVDGPGHRRWQCYKIHSWVWWVFICRLYTFIFIWFVISPVRMYSLKMFATRLFTDFIIC